MWVRLQLDFDWWDFGHGIARLGTPIDRSELADALARSWSPLALAVLSVRSGFDLFLSAMQWPAESEIVCSALNIPDMPMIARQHGLLPVPADLDLDHLAPDLDLLERAITPRTRAILIAHLYGNFVPLEPILAIGAPPWLDADQGCRGNVDGVYSGILRPMFRCSASAP